MKNKGIKPKKLVIIDFTNTLYIILFSQYLFDKYKGLRSEDMTKKDLEGLYRDSLKMVMQKMFNILEYNPEYKVDMLYLQDTKRMWRRDVFVDYKGQRKASREESPVDFRLVYKVFDKIWKEIQTLLPYRFIQIDNIEVDDIVYQVIEKEYDDYDKFQIISTDGDFVQLLRRNKVELYNPKQYKFVEPEDVEYDLFEKIIRGDKSDNIPNIFAESRDERQKPIRTKDIKNWYKDKEGFKEWLKSQPDDTKRNFIRNKKLIDMRTIPKNILNTIDVELEKDRTSFNLKLLLNTAKKYHLNFISEKVQML